MKETKKSRVPDCFETEGIVAGLKSVNFIQKTSKWNKMRELLSFPVSIILGKYCQDLERNQKEVTAPTIPVKESEEVSGFFVDLGGSRKQ